MLPIFHTQKPYCRVHAAPSAATDAVDGLFPPPANDAAAGAALNTAEPSPCGRWVAVGRDDAHVVLLPSGPDYADHPVRLLQSGITPDRMVQIDDGGTVGTQYCAFNASSSLLAASCDALRMVSVWSVASGDLLWRFTRNARAALALRFAGERTLAYTESTHALHVVDLWPSRIADARAAAAAKKALSELQKLRRQHGLKAPLAAPPARFAGLPGGGGGGDEAGGGGGDAGGGNSSSSARRSKKGAAGAAAATAAAASCLETVICFERPSGPADPTDGRLLDDAHRLHGAAAAPSGRLVVARHESLFEFLLPGALPAWSPAAHRYWPPAFKAAAQELLRGHGCDGSGGGGGGASAAAAASGKGCALARLPREAFDLILSAAAMPLSAWARRDGDDGLAVMMV